MRQRDARQALEEAYEAETKRVGLQRDKGRATGLVAVLARVSGFDAVRRQLRRYQDRRRHDHFVDELQALDEPQAQARLELQRRHEAQSLDLDRQLRALALVETRELKSLETDASKGTARQGAGPWRRQPDAGAVARTETARPTRCRLDGKNRHPSHAALEETEHAPPELPQKPTTIREEFTRAAGGDSGRGGGAGAAGSSDGGNSPGPTKPRGPSRKPRNHDRDRDDWER